MAASNGPHLASWVAAINKANTSSKADACVKKYVALLQASARAASLNSHGKLNRLYGIFLRLGEQIQWLRARV